MSIERDIHDLLYCHDCVIVPQWGGFLTHYRPARLDEARRLVHPPGKDISFNRNLTRNDGLLADHMARSQGLAFDDAVAMIGHEVIAWRSALQQHGRLELPQIGIFYLDAEQNLQFDPDHRADHLKDAHGLRPVQAVPVERPQEVPVLPLVSPEREVSAAADRSFPLLRVAAAVAVILMGAGALWLGTRTEGPQWSSLSPFRKAERTYVPASRELPSVATAGLFTLPEEGEGVHAIPLGEEDSIIVRVDLRSKASPVDSTHVAMPDPAASASVSGHQGRYHVVAGCFAQPENAERFLKDLRAKGHPARRLPRSGALHQVAYGSYTTRAEALRVLERVRRSESAQAWLLVR